ncbi:cytochrome c [Roseibium sp. RKSG952]|uniref:cytochrome c n=1 Tax=Roseibium sp. RKSG952 TaxID=2529384 RepID=UPI0012BCA334|nr:cytochrome c [Roseibium sp. RKSG952]MTH97953.1 c-type cytochrome [Roseibium sp. RKSG952]
MFTAGAKVPEVDIAELAPGNVEAGEHWFWAGGCASCHADKDAKGDDKLKLGGGLKLESPFGTFVAPNISQSDDGIGGWSLNDFASAMVHGTAPGGGNYYPSFPYTSYTRMKLQDVADLFAFMKTLPEVSGNSEPHDLAFPFNIRRGVGVWKVLFMDANPVIAGPVGLDVDTALWHRGRYLVEGAGHCGECHTPRNFLGAPLLWQWLAGAPSFEGGGKVPDITPAGLEGWSVQDIAYYFETGFTPDYDSVGGSMVAVQENLAKLAPEDREAIAVYLKAIPSVPE